METYPVVVSQARQVWYYFSHFHRGCNGWHFRPQVPFVQLVVGKRHLWNNAVHKKHVMTCYKYQKMIDTVQMAAFFGLLLMPTPESELTTWIHSVTAIWFYYSVLIAWTENISIPPKIFSFLPFQPPSRPLFTLCSVNFIYDVQSYSYLLLHPLIQR